MSKIMKIVLLEANNLGEDMVFTPFFSLGEVKIYPSTLPEEMPERVRDAAVSYTHLDVYKRQSSVM